MTGAEALKKSSDSDMSIIHISDNKYRFEVSQINEDKSTENHVGDYVTVHVFLTLNTDKTAKGYNLYYTSFMGEDYKEPFEGYYFI